MNFETLAFSAFSVTGAALVMVLAWIGKNVISTQKDMAKDHKEFAGKLEVALEKINQRFIDMNSSLVCIDRDIRDQVSDLKARVASVEAKIDQ